MLTKNYRLKCDYCGEIIRSIEFDNGTARNICRNKYDWFYDGTFEDYETCHIACRKKHMRYSKS